jgi:hypothetical protein
MVGQTEYRDHSFKRLDAKTATSKRYEMEGVIILVQDLGFGGIGLEITDKVDAVIEAESLEHAKQITIDIMDYVQTHTGSDVRKQYFYNIEQLD